MEAAQQETLKRHCIGMHVDTLSLQGAPWPMPQWLFFLLVLIPSGTIAARLR
jgi:hypothetical protein